MKCWNYINYKTSIRPIIVYCVDSATHEATIILYKLSRHYITVLKAFGVTLLLLSNNSIMLFQLKSEGTLLIKIKHTSCETQIIFTNIIMTD